MNVIVSYKQKEIIDNANIDAIKDLNGLFNVTDLIAKFKNYFFSKMILDATSIENFASQEVLTQLANGIGADRLIILLPETPEPPDEFKKMLIDLKIYNFSNNIEDVVKFINTPNTFENAMGTINGSKTFTNGYVDNSIKGENSEYDNNGENDNNSSKPSDLSTSLENMMSQSITVNDDNISNVYEEYSNNVDNKNNELKENNETDNVGNNENDLYKEPSNDKLSDNNKQNYVFLNLNGFDSKNNSLNEKKVIGFKNITLHAGSTSLIYMLLKTLIDKLNKDTIAVEINKNDFKLFLNEKMYSIDDKNISNFIESRKENVILVDLNNCENTDFCNEVVYLIEPSTIMLNRLISENRSIFKSLTNKKVILNKSLLSKDDVQILSREAGIDFVLNIEPLNDRVNNNIIEELLSILDIK